VENRSHSSSSPDPIDPLDADAPAVVDEKLAYTPVAIATVLLGQPHDGLGQCSLIVTGLWLSALIECVEVSDDEIRIFGQKSFLE
jgi:hypothetical protein